MTPLFKKYGSILISLIGVLAILGAAWWSKGTEWNDTAWLYAFCLWLVAFTVFELYSKKK